MKTVYEIGSLSQYDGTELSLVAEFILPDGTKACEALSTLEMSEIDAELYRDATFFIRFICMLKPAAHNARRILIHSKTRKYIAMRSTHC